MKLTPVEKQDLLGVYSDLNQRFNDLELDLVERMQLSAEERQLLSTMPANYGAPKNPLLKTHDDAEHEADMINSDSNESKFRRLQHFQALMEYFDNFEFELEQINLKIKEQLLDEFKVAEKLQDKARLEELMRLQKLNLEELEKYHTFAQRQLEQLLEAKKSILDLLSKLENAQYQLTLLMGNIFQTLTTTFAKATENVFEDFRIENGDPRETMLLNSIINAARHNFKALGQHLSQKLFNQPGVSFESLRNQLRENFKDLLRAKVAEQGATAKFKDIEATLNNASEEFSQKLIEKNPEFEVNVNSKLNVLTLVKADHANLTNEIQHLESLLSAVTNSIEKPKKNDSLKNILNVTYQANDILDVSNTLLPVAQNHLDVSHQILDKFAAYSVNMDALFQNAKDVIENKIDAYVVELNALNNEVVPAQDIMLSYLDALDNLQNDQVIRNDNSHADANASDDQVFQKSTSYADAMNQLDELTALGTQPEIPKEQPPAFSDDPPGYVKEANLDPANADNLARSAYIKERRVRMDRPKNAAGNNPQPDPDDNRMRGPRR